jgi:hypothetical protein
MISPLCQKRIRPSSGRSSASRLSYGRSELAVNGDEPGVEGATLAQDRPCFAAFFLGKVNFIQGVVRERVGDSYRVFAAGNTLLCPADHDRPAFTQDAPVVLGVRPEHLSLDDAPQPAGRNTLKGRIVREKFIGKVVQFEVEIEGGSTVVVDGSLAQAKEASPSPSPTTRRPAPSRPWVPLSLDMSELKGNEKHADLPLALPTKTLVRLRSRGTRLE